MHEIIIAVSLSRQGATLLLFHAVEFLFIVHTTLRSTSQKRDSHRRDSHRRSSSFLRRVSFSRHKEDDEIPLVTIDEPGGEPDVISENEMIGYRDQIMKLSSENEQKRRSFTDMGTPVVSIVINHMLYICSYMKYFRWFYLLLLPLSANSAIICAHRRQNEIYAHLTLLVLI